MDKIEYLDRLYYQFGRQITDFEMQILSLDSASKRKPYSEIGFKKDMWWLEKVNNRTILLNEIVLDIDPDKGETTEDFENRILKTIEEIKMYNFDYWGIFNSNRGVHIHLFQNRLMNLSPDERKKTRESLISRFKADMNKTSEKSNIALELTPHWKSGKIKEYLRGNLW